MVIRIQNFFLLVLVGVAIAADTTGWYQMKIGGAFLTISSDGYLKYLTEGNGQPAAFKDVQENGKLKIMIMTGPYANTLLVRAPLGLGCLGSRKIANVPFGGFSSDLYENYRWRGCFLDAEYGSTIQTNLQYIRDKGFTFWTDLTTTPVCITKQPTGCKATSVVGSWKYVQTLSGTTKFSVTTGINKRYEQSLSQEWGLSVSAQASLEFGIKGLGSGTISTGYEFRTTAVAAYSDEWSTSQQKTQEVQFPDSALGRSLWQFVTVIKDSCDHEETALLPEYALTKNKKNAPCCLPGYSDDAPYYTICIEKDALIETSSAACSVSVSRRRWIY